MKCFYHSADLDGYCSGAIIKNEFTDCEMIGINYGEKFPWDDIKSDEIIFMVDFSLTYVDMIKLNNICDHLIWIDHHKTAIESELDYVESLEGFPNIEPPIKGLRRVGIGACALVWEFLYPERDIPYAIQLLAEYDVWNHSNPETLPFQYGMRIQYNLPESPVWNYVFSYDNTKFLLDMINSGKSILKYITQYEERYAKGNYFTTRITSFEEYNCIAINKALSNSLLFNSVKGEDTDIMIAFCWNGKVRKWAVSLYTEKEDIDVSTIAKFYGGGGHKGAAGFSCDLVLPFSFN